MISHPQAASIPRVNGVRLALDFVLLCVLFFLPASWSGAAESQAGDLLAQAREAFDKGSLDQAIALAAKAVEKSPDDPQAYYVRARALDAQRQFEKAIADYSKVLELNPRAVQAYHLRGGVHFRLGHIDESLRDFDKFLEADPGQAPYHWQRGISYYYAGRFEDGRKQFESHQTVNRNDVENAVWHFLCVVRSAGLDRARASLIPIKEDRRVPMMQVHALFAGKLKPEEVLSAAQAGNPEAAELKQRLLYAHLYLGLYFEALGETQKASEHIIQAAGKYAMDHYMGDVARVHAQLRKWTPKKD